MLFLDEDDFYYASPIKYSDLTAYCDVLLSSGVDVRRFDKNELICDKSTFARVENSLVYRVDLLTD